MHTREAEHSSGSGLRVGSRGSRGEYRPGSTCTSRRRPEAIVGATRRNARSQGDGANVAGVSSLRCRVNGTHFDRTSTSRPAGSTRPRPRGDQARWGSRDVHATDTSGIDEGHGAVVRSKTPDHSRLEKPTTVPPQPPTTNEVIAPTDGDPQKSRAVTASPQFDAKARSRTRRPTNPSVVPRRANRTVDDDTSLRAERHWFQNDDCRRTATRRRQVADRRWWPRVAAESSARGERGVERCCSSMPQSWDEDRARSPQAYREFVAVKRISWMRLAMVLWPSRLSG